MSKHGLEMIKSELIHEIINSKTYRMNENTSNNINAKHKSQMIHLLPAYNEYIIAYKDRSAVLDSHYIIQTGNGIFSPVIISDGRIIGVWKRILKKDRVAIQINSFCTLCKVQKIELENEIKHYADFLNMMLFVDNSTV